METLPLEPFKMVIDGINESGGEAFKFCYQCGKCETVCPWNNVRYFPVRKYINQAKYGVVPFESEDVWLCATCGRCPQYCPRGVEIIEVMRSVRRLLVPDGVVPASLPSLRSTMTNIASVGNPWGQDPNERMNWAKDLEVKEFDETTEILYFPCCYPSYDPRLKKVSQATANILNKAGVNFGVLGSKEMCCGESVRKTGNEALFKRLAKENIKTWIDSGVKKILVSSPHCFHTFKNEYPEFSVNFEVIHISQFLFELINEGRLTIKKEYARKVTYHDPCYLGRHNGVYDEPRGVLQKIPGLELIEITDNHKDSLCCGMGGGRVWMETEKNERFANIRIEQAIATGAQVLATACPYCVFALEDSKLVTNHADDIEIKDITEILQEVI
ncbi:MAG TPA: (Fe-S)-binding protein [Syntrophorhabdaceae bacterium]|jgi:Fe-S oxidoreductase|nr:(Fe-S)-binding protein [Syntrophorhabdaceae bacterium]MDI9561791.1 (Fe-S)-binding protein [Pseudomonadota bacterium]OQC51699.1 MAG: Anaerobic glycerol-3-phosphate dehydrogenase subunit C [Deltaproteobacteria bacterium ADurb.Bin026]MBP8697984.1 (Fe-S)-binding protein [Syntrophorhabdaceae bacterium]HPH41923.1 (Fe-S)-binding protein [Syntrophorhabdaceae bacterium]